MSTLTEYRRPTPRYGLGDHGWRARTRWEITEGRWQRRFMILRKFRSTRWRRAEIFRKAGLWSWRVLERTGGGEWREVARAKDAGGRDYYTAQMAMPYAELAATTA